jgi:hypothetical protein
MGVKKANGYLIYCQIIYFGDTTFFRAKSIKLV